MKIVDASVTLKWVYLEDSGTETARDLLSSGAPLLAPSLWLLECGNALWKRVRMGLLQVDEATALHRYFIDGPVRLVELRELADAALSLANLMSHPIYDCTYLALALHEDAPLVTADERFAVVAGRAGFGGALELIGPDHP